jgi:hypothetical protein
VTRQQVQQRLTQEVMSLFWGHAPLMFAVLAFFAFLFIALMYCFFGAVLAAMNYSDLPCDEPLKYYVLVICLWSQFPGRVVQCLQDRYSLGPYGVAAAAIAMSVPGWILIGWGVYMVTESETCHETNPVLFYKTRNYVYAQVMFAAGLLVVSLYSIFGLHSLLLIINRLNATPGCQKAVQKLEKVPLDSADLVDAEDGRVADCPICLDSLAGTDRTKEVVRAPCKHCYHEECLTTWCKNHLDCPLCRQGIGEPDEMEDASQAAV